MPPVIRPRVKIIDKAEAQKRLQRIAKQSRNSYANVGIIAPDQVYPGTDITVGQVAAYMEFGTKHMLPRSFLRTPIDVSLPLIDKVRVRALGDIVKGQISIAEALERLGVFVSNRIVNFIRTKRLRDLKPETIERKRDGDRPNKGASPTPSTPLMDTGLLISKISYEVILDGKGR